MTLPRYYALSRYWADHPPLHLMVAAYLGYGGRARPSPPADLSELVGLFGGAGGVIR